MNPVTFAAQTAAVLRRYLRAGSGLALLLAALLTAPAVAAGHAYADLGTPKYPAGFSHFDYVNPAAPKGGDLNLSNTGATSSFDKLNPFTLRGRSAPGSQELLFETLTVYSLDEPNTQYGLLAADIRVAPDLGSVQFSLDARARFSNGEPVTAADVKYSFETLAGGLANPKFAAYFSEIERVVVVDARTVRFDFKRPGRDLPFVAGSLPVFSAQWGAHADGTRIPFPELRLEPPVASGPYAVERMVPGRNITYRLRDDWWAKDIPARRGMFNFGRITYRLFKDKDTQVSGLRAGVYDYYNEPHMRYWCCQYIGQRFDSGELVKRLFPHHNPPAMGGYVYNLRQPRFQDVRVRQALTYAFDFEWVNQKIFDNEFDRITSYFTDTPFAASGVPQGEELALLETYRDRLDPAVFGPAVELGVNRSPAVFRQRLLKAQALLGEAGWRYRDGALRNAAGEPFVIAVNASSGPNLLLDHYYKALAKLGIVVEKRLSDPATNFSRIRNFDFDFLMWYTRESRFPGLELWRTFNSAAAGQIGSDNVAGVRSPVIDELLQQLLDADSPAEYATVARALDRVLMHGYYVIPWRYLKNHYLVYHQRLRHPVQLPRYYAADDWVISTWWDAAAGDGVASGPR